MLGQPRVFGACRGDTEQVDLNRILGVHRDVLLISYISAEGDHRPSITGVSGMSPAISAASGVAMSRGENTSVPLYSAMSLCRHHRIPVMCSTASSSSD